MEKTKLNLNQYQFMALLIKHGLICIRGNSLLAIAYRNGALTNFPETIAAIKKDYADNPNAVREIIGNTLLTQILDYELKTTDSKG